MTTRVIITVHRGGQTTRDVTLTALVDGSPKQQFDAQQGVWYVDLLDGASNLKIMAALTPRPIITHFPLQGEFDVSDPSDLVLIDVPDEFDFEANASVSAGGNRLHRVRIHLSRVRDVTAKVNAVLADHGDDFSAPAREVFALDAGELFDSTTPGSPGPRFHRESIDPAADFRVLEIAGVEAPQLVAVSWPTALTPAPDSPATPLMIYFRPSVGQNPAYYAQVRPPDPTREYPFGLRYLYSGLWGFFHYTSDPLAEDPFPKGLPYQLAAESQPIVTVLPLPRLIRELTRLPRRRENEVGVFLDAGELQEVLTEIQAHFFRRERIFANLPALGRVALASFSNGAIFTAQFLAANRNHPFCREVLREVYLFEPTNARLGVSQAIAWSNQGGDKLVRLYTTRASSLHSALVGGTAPATPFEVHSDDGRRTAVAIGLSTWRPIVEAARAELAADSVRPAADRKPIDEQFIHQVISATLLTHAVRSSGF